MHGQRPGRRIGQFDAIAIEPGGNRHFDVGVIVLAYYRLHGPFHRDPLAVKSSGKQLHERNRWRFGQPAPSEHMEAGFGDDGREGSLIDDSLQLRHVSLANRGETRCQHKNAGSRILKKHCVKIAIIIADDAAQLHWNLSLHTT